MGPITVKQGVKDGQVFQSSPEYEECRKIAQEHGKPLKQVYAAVWKQL